MTRPAPDLAKAALNLASAIEFSWMRHRTPLASNAEVHHAATVLREVAGLLEQQHEALWLAYAAVDELCARPGTCLPIRPRLGGDGQ